MKAAKRSEFEAEQRVSSASTREYYNCSMYRDALRGSRTGGWVPDLPLYVDPVLPAPLVNDRMGEAEPLNKVGGRTGCINGGRPYLGSGNNPVNSAETYPQIDSDCDYRLVSGSDARSVEGRHPERSSIDRPRIMNNRRGDDVMEKTLNYRKDTTPTGWMPDLPANRNFHSWIEEVAYEAACNCGGDVSVQHWILEILDDAHDMSVFCLPMNKSWRELDLNIAEEVKFLLNKTSDDFANIRDKVSLLKRRAMREKRIIGGREMLLCMITSYGPIEKRNCIDELNALCVPSLKTLEKFYMDWQDIIIDFDEHEHVMELQRILERKLCDSEIFEYEMRAIDLWDITCDKVYMMYKSMIEKRILKESKRSSDNKRKPNNKMAPVQNNATRGANDRKERILHGDHDRTEITPQSQKSDNFPPIHSDEAKNDSQIEVALPHSPVSFKGKGKGKTKGTIENPMFRSENNVNVVPSNRAGLDDKLLLLCKTLKGCYEYASGRCTRENCYFRHLTRSEMESEIRMLSSQVTTAGA